MKLLFLTLFIFFFVAVFGQKKIELKDVSKHVGDSVKLEGKIVGVKTFPDNLKAPTLLNLGADFPKQILTIAVFPSYASENIVMSNEGFLGDIAIVVGKIELYKGKPQITVKTPDALRIVASGPVTPARQ